MAQDIIDSITTNICNTMRMCYFVIILDKQKTYSLYKLRGCDGILVGKHKQVNRLLRVSVGAHNKIYSDHSSLEY